MNLQIETVQTPTQEVRELVGELNRVLAAGYDDDQRHGLAVEQIFQPNVRFFLSRLDGAAAGCGGVALFDEYAEVKRMYTRESARGRGLAKALLRRIETEAREFGAKLLTLETGVYQREAIGLYERVGFQRCGPFGPYADMPARAIELSLFFEKAL
jgi:putative acetyltransferase